MSTQVFRPKSQNATPALPWPGLGARLAVLVGYIAISMTVDAQTPYSPPRLVLHAGHGSEITSLEFAHRKRMLATGSEDGAIKLWDTSSGLELLTLPSEATAIRGLAMFPNDRRLAAADQTGRVTIWELQGQRRVASLDLGEPLSRIALSKDGRWLAAASEKGKIVVWNTTTLENLLELHDVQSPTHLAFTADGALRATNRLAYDPRTDHADIEWSLPWGGVLRKQGHIVPIALSPDGRTLLSMPNDNVGEGDLARLSDEAGGVLAEWQFPNSQEDIADADLSPDGKILVMACMSLSGNAHEFTYVRVLDAYSGAVLYTLAGRDENAAINSLVRFSPDGKSIAVVAENDVTLFDARSGRRLGQIAWPGRPNVVRFSPGGHWLGIIVRRTLKLWDLASGELAMNLGPVSGAARVAFSRNDRYVASWNFDPATLNGRAPMKRYQVKIWDLENGGEIRTPSEEGPLNDIAFSPDEKQLAYSINAFVVLCDPQPAR
jgi:WD40 repeat protein